MLQRANKQTRHLKLIIVISARFWFGLVWFGFPKNIILQNCFSPTEVKSVGISKISETVSEIGQQAQNYF
jgi:hypothetical protein